MERLVFESHEEDSRHLTVKGDLSSGDISVEGQESSSDSALEVHNGRERGPILRLLRYFRMGLCATISS